MSETSHNQAISFRELSIPREGNHLYAREYPGAGPTFVLLHGFPDNLQIYDLLIPFLVKAGRHVVAFDFLGFGASDKPAGFDYNFQQQLGDLEAVASFLHLEKIACVGHDAGGVTAIDCALAHPELVSNLFLLNMFYGNSPTLRFPELVELFAVPELTELAMAMAMSAEQFGFLLSFQQGQLKKGVSAAQRDIIDSVVRPILVANFTQVPSAGPAFAGLASKLRDQMERNNAHLLLLKGLSATSTLVWGESDAYLNVGVAKDIAAHLGDASLHVLDAGHWPQLDLPEEVAAILLAAM
ncbi:pimeloyl-ACP methyl ester carboxylesterase [Granulicella aggregans]|uniref:Pimeloyl-ACP methyl ester carboxylesterase n=1 Tax=Granulicella aggregans TaxID=474949 RepID=A0A7W7ZGW2_9BACT|nr:alpha/beta hydrolase [Granulicella aggregans]MBB5059633.1 pimeloyl-ACP methyl ester carboxylesterase [Granulicella aggregans]